MPEDVKPQGEPPVVDTPVDGGTNPELQPGQTTDENNGVVPVPETPPDPDTPRDDAAKRYSTLSRRLEDAQRVIEEKDRLLSDANRTLYQFVGKPDEVKPPEVPEEIPVPEFTDPEQYTRDMAEYTRKQTERAVADSMKRILAEREQDAQRAQAQARDRAVQVAWATRRDKAITETPDYQAVAENPDVPISRAMASVIMADEAGPKIAYYLGKHIDEAKRISALDPFMQSVELGALRERILSPTKPTTSRAPAPIKPLTGARSPASKSPDEMSMEEYAASRRK